MLGIGCAVSMIAASGAPRFSPSMLYAAMQAGLWLDQSDNSSGYQDSAGTTALYAPGAGSIDPPVGKRNDKSGRGNHVTQATAAARPVVSARVNLLTGTENLAGWTSTLGSIASGSLAPDGSLTAIKLTESAVNATQYVYFSLPTKTASEKRVQRLWAKRNGRDLRITWVTGSSASGAYADINLATGVVANLGVNGTTAVANAGTVTSAGTEWWEIVLTSTLPNAELSYFVIQLRNNLTNVTGEPSYVGDGASGAFVWHPDMRHFATANSSTPTYQRITDANTYDTVGFPYYEKFDGLDDGYATAAFTAGTLTADMDCFVAIKRNSAANFLVASLASGSALYVGAGDSADAVNPVNSVGATCWVNGAAVANNRAAFAAAVPVGSWVIGEFRNADFSTWTAFQISQFVGWYLNGEIAGVILCPAQTDAKRGQIRRWLATNATKGMAVVV